MDQPGESECQEALLNDIVAITVREWPQPLQLHMPSLWYNCVKRGEGGRLAAHPDEVEPHSVGSSGWLPWWIYWTGPLHSFVIGQDTVSVDLAGTVEVDGIGGITATTSWPNTTMHYLFQEGTTEVLAPSGSTGVSDLGEHESTPSGEFWSATLHIVLYGLGDGDWKCTVGPVGQSVRASGRNIVRLDYPLAWTGVPDVLAKDIRARFQRSVRLAVTGAP